MSDFQFRTALSKVITGKLSPLGKLEAISHLIDQGIIGDDEKGGGFSDEKWTKFTPESPIVREHYRNELKAQQRLRLKGGSDEH